MITIDLSQIKSEKDNLSDFLKQRIKAVITVEKDVLVLSVKEEEPSVKDVKRLIKKFLRQKSLEDKYTVIEKERIYRVIRKDDVAVNIEQKDGKKHDSKNNGTPPSVYDTLPYLFPR